MAGLNTARQQILSNRAQSTAGGSCPEYYNALTPGPDSEIFATWTGKPINDGERLELYVRVTNPTTASLAGYRLRIAINGTSCDWGIHVVTAASGTVIGTTVAQNVTVGQKVGLEVIGSTLTAYLFDGSSWTSVLSRTDSAHSSAGRIATNLNGLSNSIDDTGGGTVVTGGGTVTVKQLAALGVG